MRDKPTSTANVVCHAGEKWHILVVQIGLAGGHHKQTVLQKLILLSDLCSEVQRL